MDWSTLFSGLMQNPPTGGAPGAPVQGAAGPSSYGGPNGPQPLAQPTGILNGQQAPGGNALLQQAQKLMAPPQAPPAMPQIQQARPVGAQGIDPVKLLAAMQQNKLMNA